MPRTSSRNLTLETTNNEKTKIRVTYNVRFGAFEHFSANHGIEFRDAIEVLRVASADATTGERVAAFDPEPIPLGHGSDPVDISRDRTLEVERSVLDGDASPGQKDLIRCRIEIHPVGVLISSSDFTDAEFA